MTSTFLLKKKLKRVKNTCFLRDIQHYFCQIINSAEFIHKFDNFKYLFIIFNLSSMVFEKKFAAYHRVI
jgi:hypothetical protein